MIARFGSKTGGGRGTNQYATRGTSQATPSVNDMRIVPVPDALGPIGGLSKPLRACADELRSAYPGAHLVQAVVVHDEEGQPGVRWGSVADRNGESLEDDPQSLSDGRLVPSPECARALIGAASQAGVLFDDGVHATFNVDLTALRRINPKASLHQVVSAV
jgi:hypothetical protein